MEPTTILLFLALLFGLYMAWGIGANDVANAMATSVGAKAVTVKQAILIAAIFEFLGAFLAGGEVTSTIRKGIIDSTSLAGNPDVLIIGMLSALLAAAVWLTVASRFGWPVSTTHSIIGAIVGFAVITVMDLSGETEDVVVSILVKQKKLELVTQDKIALNKAL